MKFLFTRLLSLVALLGLSSLPAFSSSDRVVLSSEGSGRATAYIESPKIISFEGKTHVAWLDTPAEGFRIRIKTLDHATGHWSESTDIGEAIDNHGGPPSPSTKPVISTSFTSPITILFATAARFAPMMPPNGPTTKSLASTSLTPA